MKRVEYVIEPNRKVKNKKYIWIICCIIVIIIAAIVLTGLVINKSKATEELTDKDVTYSSETSQETEKQELSIEKNLDVLDIKNILNENTKNVETKTLVVDEMDLDYTTVYRENSELPTGAIQTIQDGVDGTQQVIIVKTYSGNEYVGEERVTSRVIKSAVDKIVEIGTGEEEYTYTPKARR